MQNGCCDQCKLSLKFGVHATNQVTRRLSECCERCAFNYNNVYMPKEQHDMTLTERALINETDLHYGISRKSNHSITTIPDQKTNDCT